MTTPNSEFGHHVQSLLDSTQAENMSTIQRLQVERDALENAFNYIGKAVGPVTLDADSLVMTPSERMVAAIIALRTRAEAAERGFTLRGQMLEELNAKIAALESFQPMAEIERLKREDAEHCDRQDAEIVRLMKELTALRARAETAERERALLIEYVKATEYWKIEPHDQKERSAFFAYRLKEILQPTQKGGDEPCAPTNSLMDSGTQSQAASNAAPTGPTHSVAATPIVDACKFDATPESEDLEETMEVVSVKDARILERELTAERAKSAGLANSFGAELTAIQSLLTNAGITGHEDAAAYSVGDAVEELIASRDAERTARVKAEEGLRFFRTDLLKTMTDRDQLRAELESIKAERLKG